MGSFRSLEVLPLGNQHGKRIHGTTLSGSDVIVKCELWCCQSVAYGAPEGPPMRFESSCCLWVEHVTWLRLREHPSLDLMKSRKGWRVRVSVSYTYQPFPLFVALSATD